MKQMIYAIIGVFSFWMLLSPIIESCDEKRGGRPLLHYFMLEYDLEDKIIEEVWDYYSEDVIIDAETYFVDIKDEFIEDNVVYYNFTFTLCITNAFGVEIYYDCKAVATQNLDITECEKSNPRTSLF